MKASPLSPIWFSLLITSTGWSSAHAASFDCKKANGQVEKAICDDRTLSGLDSRMAGLYRNLTHTPKLYFMRDNLRAEQRDWLKQRNQACQNASQHDLVSCLQSEYNARITALSNQTQTFDSRVYVATPKQCYRIRFDDLAYANANQSSCYEKTYLNRRDVKTFFGTNLDSIKGFEKSVRLDKNSMTKRSNCDRFKGNGEEQNQYLYVEDIDYINNNILSTSVTEWAYEGGAHGNGATSFYNLDRHTHDIVHWEDMLPDSKAFDAYVTEQVINTIADKMYLKMTSKHSPQTEVANFKKLGYFSIRHDGLFIQYPPYEIGPYAMGNPSLTIPLNTLKDYLPKSKYDYYFGQPPETKLVANCP